MHIDDGIEELATAQFGLLSTAQLRERGITRSAEATFVSRGILTRVRRGVVRVRGAAPSWEQSVAAVVLSAGAPVATSHRSSARLWGLRSHDTALAFTVPHSRRLQVPGGRVHRSLDLIESDIELRMGLPTTSVERTICDLGASLPMRELRRMTDHAVATGLTTIDRIGDFVDRVGGRGRPGVAATRRLVSRHAAADHLAESGPEVALARICREHDLPLPVPQHPVRAGGCRYRLDLAFPRQRVYLEFDGLRWHSSPEAIARDHRRQNALASTGWIPLRFSWLDLRDRPEAVAAQIRATLAVR